MLTSRLRCLITQLCYLGGYKEGTDNHQRSGQLTLITWRQTLLQSEDRIEETSLNGIRSPTPHFDQQKPRERSGRSSCHSTINIPLFPQTPLHLLRPSFHPAPSSKQQPVTFHHSLHPNRAKQNRTRENTKPNLPSSHPPRPRHQE